MIRFLKPSLMVIAATAMLLVSSSAIATTIISVLPEFTGPRVETGFPSSHNLGAFVYSIPAGEVIIFASYSSSFGNNVESSTSPMQVLVDSIVVATCPDQAAQCADNIPDNPLPITHTFTPADFAALADGSAALSIFQTDTFTARLGESTLTIETVASDLASTPEPASLTLMAVGLTSAVSAVWRRRRRPQPDA